MNAAGDALEAAIRRTKIRAAIAAAAGAPETWIIAAALLYLAARFAPWALAGFPVAGAL